MGRDWKILTGLRTNQIAGFVTAPSKKKKIIIILKRKRITTNNNKAMEVGVMVSIEGFHNLQV